MLAQVRRLVQRSDYAFGSEQICDIELDLPRQQFPQVGQELVQRTLPRKRSGKEDKIATSLEPLAMQAQILPH